jgi:hypothetical protein
MSKLQLCAPPHPDEITSTQIKPVLLIAVGYARFWQCNLILFASRRIQ